MVNIYQTEKERDRESPIQDESDRAIQTKISQEVGLHRDQNLQYDKFFKWCPNLLNPFERKNLKKNLKLKNFWFSKRWRVENEMDF